MSLTTQLTARVRAALTGSADHGTPQASIELAKTLTLLNGTGANQCDLVFSDQRTLAASANEELDLYGVLTDLLGATLSFAKIKAVLIVAAAGNTNNVVVGNAAANQAQLGFGATTQTWAIPPGGLFFVAAPVAGWAITNATADKLKLANSGGTTSVTYDIVILGTSV